MMVTRENYITVRDDMEEVVDIMFDGKLVTAETSSSAAEKWISEDIKRRNSVKEGL